MNKSDKINFSTPSGFPEFLPSEKRLKVYLLDIIRKVFESYGFTPIETPAGNAHPTQYFKNQMLVLYIPVKRANSRIGDKRFLIPNNQFT